MTVGLLTEKPSAARAFSKALGGDSGTYNGESYVIAHARGHLYELAQPEDQLIGATPEERSAMKAWNLDNLPWNLGRFEWKYVEMDRVGQLLKDIRSKLSKCDEIVVATDVDPTGEGGLIFASIAKGLGLDGKRISRMYFTDEAPASLQKAFTSRKPIPDLEQFDEYKKAAYRSAMDFATIQFTRVATNMARQSGQSTVLRQGRLKSAMVKLVGDQLKAYDDYVKKPFFQNRFRDENDVVYTDPEEPRFDAKGQVPQQYGPSPVVLDGKANKQTAPPKLLDLAALSSMLVGKGIKAKLVLDTYQKMYEAQAVSYPRTEDKTITPEQFKELAPLIDKIAAVVGVDTKHLTHRQPRGTHVKAQGAHGANRPGPKVPSSLDAVESQYGKAGRLIYETLAKNYLAMIAEDYVYEQQKGHVEKWPDFVGIANVPLSAGWRAVFDPDAGEDPADADGDENESAKGLGSSAEPFVFEGANKRPEHPSMKWLMKQLEKRDVGTGATRTSTYSEVTSTSTKYPLLVEKGRKLALAENGEMSWHLLPGTRIGDLELTEKVYADMKAIAEGRATTEECLAAVADWVREDIATMQLNAATMRQSMGLKETQVAPYAEGMWQKAPGGPKQVKFKKVFSGHEFTDDEIAKLLAGEKLSFEATSKAGRPYEASGALGLGEFTKQGKTYKYVGFQLEMAEHPTKWSGRMFTPDEITRLEAGEWLEIDDFVSSRTGKGFGCKVAWDAKTKKIVPDFGSDDEPPRSWCGVKLTDAQRKDLAAGKTIEGQGFTSKKSGKSFDAKLTWKDEGGKKKLVPSFG